jgi:tetratricopeptide (TPR) repeat protein
MSDFTESSNNDTPALAYYVQAISAFEQGRRAYSEELCRKAVELYERAGKDEVSEVYGQLGLIAHCRGDFDAAEKWYRKTLEIVERNGNEQGAAKTKLFERCRQSS